MLDYTIKQGYSGKGSRFPRANDNRYLVNTSHGWVTRIVDNIVRHCRAGLIKLGNPKLPGMQGPQEKTILPQFKQGCRGGAGGSDTY